VDELVAGKSCGYLGSSLPLTRAASIQHGLANPRYVNTRIDALKPMISAGSAQRTAHSGSQLPRRVTLDELKAIARAKGGDCLVGTDGSEELFMFWAGFLNDLIGGRRIRRVPAQAQRGADLHGAIEAIGREIELAPG
jgi:hypothetical protein